MLMQLQPEQGQLGNWSYSILNSELVHVWLENRGRGVCALQGVGKHKTGKKKKDARDKIKQTLSCRLIVLCKLYIVCVVECTG